MKRRVLYKKVSRNLLMLAMFGALNPAHMFSKEDIISIVLIVFIVLFMVMLFISSVVRYVEHKVFEE